MASERGDAGGQSVSTAGPMVTTLQQLLVHGGFVSRRQPYGNLVDTDFATRAMPTAA